MISIVCPRLQFPLFFDEYTHTRHRSTIESDTRGTIQDFFFDTSSILPGEFDRNENKHHTEIQNGK